MLKGMVELFEILNNIKKLKVLLYFLNAGFYFLLVLIVLLKPMCKSFYNKAIEEANSLRLN